MGAFKTLDQLTKYQLIDHLIGRIENDYDEVIKGIPDSEFYVRDNYTRMMKKWEGVERYATPAERERFHRTRRKLEDYFIKEGLWANGLVY